MEGEENCNFAFFSLQIPDSPPPPIAASFSWPWEPAQDKAQLAASKRSRCQQNSHESSVFSRGSVNFAWQATEPFFWHTSFLFRVFGNLHLQYMIQLASKRLDSHRDAFPITRVELNSCFSSFPNRLFLANYAIAPTMHHFMHESKYKACIKGMSKKEASQTKGLNWNELCPPLY